jgi:hypothetical protein
MPHSIRSRAWAKSQTSATTEEGNPSSKSAQRPAALAGPLERRPVASLLQLSAAPIAKKVMRSPATRERLGRLRRELLKIDPPPNDPHEARMEIVNALARAHLSGWTVPELTDPMTTRYPDGSVRITLVSHVIVINPYGAFRIVDSHAPRTPYFEMRGRDDRAFELPAWAPEGGVNGADCPLAPECSRQRPCLRCPHRSAGSRG